MSKTILIKLLIGTIFLTLSLLVVHGFLSRNEFLPLFLTYSLAFFSYLYLIYHLKFSKSFIVILSASLGIRLLFFVYQPSLSDDYFRFFWDGQLLLEGISPYLATPKDALMFFSNSEYMDSLFLQMNSPNYHSVYPPLNQLFFVVSAAIGGNNLMLNILILRIILLVFEGLNVFFLFKILNLLKRSTSLVWFYALNPLVILEGIGNLHIEVVVLTGLFGLIYSFLKCKPFWAGFSWSFAVGVKLLPLMLGFLFIKMWPKKSRIKFFVSAFIFGFIFLGILIFPPYMHGFLSGIELFHKNFEFNASLYYLFRWPLQLWLGYNPIAQLVPVMQIILFLFIIYISFGVKSFTVIQVIKRICGIYLLYLFFQPVVHPWYIIPAFGLSILIRDRVFLFWTWIIFLSYHAYSQTEVEELPWILIIEYTLLGLMIFRYNWFLIIKTGLKSIRNRS